jgi:hypothetical protein
MAEQVLPLQLFMQPSPGNEEGEKQVRELVCKRPGEWERRGMEKLGWLERRMDLSCYFEIANHTRV